MVRIVVVVVGALKDSSEAVEYSRVEGATKVISVRLSGEIIAVEFEDSFEHIHRHGDHQISLRPPLPRESVEAAGVEQLGLRHSQHRHRQGGQRGVGAVPRGPEDNGAARPTKGRRGTASASASPTACAVTANFDGDGEGGGVGGRRITIVDLLMLLHRSRGSCGRHAAARRRGEAESRVVGVGAAV